MISAERFKDFKAEHVLNGLQLSFLETMMMFNRGGVKKLRYMTKKEFSDAYYGMTTLPFSLEVSEATVRHIQIHNPHINCIHFIGEKGHDDEQGCVEGKTIHTHFSFSFHTKQCTFFNIT